MHRRSHSHSRLRSKSKKNLWHQKRKSSRVRTHQTAHPVWKTFNSHLSTTHKSPSITISTLLRSHSDTQPMKTLCQLTSYQCQPIRNQQVISEYPNDLTLLWPNAVNHPHVMFNMSECLQSTEGHESCDPVSDHHHLRKSANHLQKRMNHSKWWVKSDIDEGVSC